MTSNGQANCDLEKHGIEIEPEGTAEQSGIKINVIRIQANSEGGAGLDPTLWLYRERTVAVLRRYLRIALEVGRLPSLLGREFFRSKVTSYRAHTFADAAIFVLDVERSLELLSEFDRSLIGTIALQEYTYAEAAQILGCGHRTIPRAYPEALDRVSEIFLQRGILTALPNAETGCPESCQGGGMVQIDVSDSEESE